MKIVMTLLVRDEIDIIDQNINFHLQNGVDFIIATDNLSKDGTIDILKKYEQRGKLQLIEEKNDNYHQAKWVTRMARIAHEEHRADWIIHSDADEFWWTNQNDIKGVLCQVEEKVDILEVQRFNFIPRPEKEGPLFDRMVFRESISLNSLGQPLPPKIIHRSLNDVQVAQGNHSIVFPTNLCLIKSNDIQILHFPLRTYAQYENKIQLGGAAYKRNKDLPQQMGRTWRESYKAFLKGNLEDEFYKTLIDDERLESFTLSQKIIVDRRLQKWLTDRYGG